MIPCAVVFGAFDVVEADYEYTINNDHWFNLATGVYEYNVDYNTTNRIAIKYDSINLYNFTSFHHLLFFKNNEYLGYYNSQITTYIVPETFLGVLNTFTPTIPTGATHFVVVDYNNYKNLVPKEELNNHTLREVFEESTIYGVGKNLFDKSKVSLNSEVNHLTGDIYTANNNSATDYILIKPNTQYYWYYGTVTIGRFLAFYDINKQYISGLSGGAIISWTSPTNAYYVRTTIATVELDKGQLEQGTVATTYEPYKSSLNDDLPPFVYWYNLDTLGISSLTVQQMDSYYELYRSNLTSDVYYQHYRNLTDNPPLISYIYEKPIPDDTPPLDKIDNFLDDLGIGSKGFKLFISIAVIAITMILLVIVFNAPTLLIVMSAVLEVVLFVFMKWIPNYVIIVLAVIVFILIVKEKGEKNEA
ncbi:MAG: hypothetical protein QXI16_00510 [Sulfolobaceae archaeon]